MSEPFKNARHHPQPGNPSLPAFARQPAGAIDRSRADQQDIRPLEIAIINPMADKISTERQLALWLGNTMLQVHLTFVATGLIRARRSGWTSHHRIRPPITSSKFYRAFTDIRHQKFDGFVVTGVNALSPASNRRSSGRKSPTFCNG